jgi:hypothetical protein
MIIAWKLYFSNAKNIAVFFFTLTLLVIVLYCFTYFLIFNESRRGYDFNDPVLSLFTPIDVSMHIFVLTYVVSITGIILVLQKPVLFVQILQVYTGILLLRMFTMYLLPLEAPASIIPLKDFFLENTFYQNTTVLKDLFFSGHTATVCMFGVCFRNKTLKIIFYMFAAMIGFLLILQHVHYTIDVLVAPLFVFLAVYLQKQINLLINF